MNTLLGKGFNLERAASGRGLPWRPSAAAAPAAGGPLSSSYTTDQAPGGLQ